MADRQKDQEILLVPTRVLMLFAAFFWLAAGSSVIITGLKASTKPWTLQMVVAMLAVFVLFLVIFTRISHRNTMRICGITRRLSFILNFFDVNSYLIMTVMIFFSAALRLSTFVPDAILAFFYSGLGFALLLSGFYPIITFICTLDDPRFHNT